MKNNNSHKQPGLRLPLLPAPPRPRAPGLAPPDGAAREWGPARDEAVSPCPGRAVGAQFPAQMAGLGAPLRHTCGLSTPPPGRAGAAPQVRGGSCTPRPQPRTRRRVPAAPGLCGPTSPGFPQILLTPLHPNGSRGEQGRRKRGGGEGRLGAPSASPAAPPRLHLGRKNKNPGGDGERPPPAQVPVGGRRPCRWVGEGPVPSTSRAVTGPLSVGFYPTPAPVRGETRGAPAAPGQPPPLCPNPPLLCPQTV